MLKFFYSKGQNLVFYRLGIGAYKAEKLDLTYTLGCSDLCRLSTMVEF